jgi:tRNA(Ile)-lysidine synthase
MPIAPTLAERVAERLDWLAPRSARVLVAVSGGPDSLALLDLLYLGADVHRRALVVGHVDHGIAAWSGAVAEQVVAAARQRRLDVVVERLALGAQTSETAARRARRPALRRLAAGANAAVIALAHQADDQAETVLLRLLRGSGPAGLAGMAARSGVWIRPLLDIGREELAQHLERRGIAAWDDPANCDSRHLRSWLRGDIMPRLAARLPDVRRRLLDTARQAGSARRGWQAVPELIPALQCRNERHGISVAAVPLSGYRSDVRHAILAALGRRFGVPLGRRRLKTLDHLLADPSGNRRCRLSARLEAELHGRRLTLYVVRSPVITPVALHVGHTILTGEAEFETHTGPAERPTRSGWSTTMTPGAYLARPWRPGDRIRPLGGRGSRTVAVLLREACVAPHRRRRWPVLVSAEDATIIWVPGICRSDARLPEPGRDAWHVECAFA